MSDQAVIHFQPIFHLSFLVYSDCLQIPTTTKGTIWDRNEEEEDLGLNRENRMGNGKESTPKTFSKISSGKTLPSSSPAFSSVSAAKPSSSSSSCVDSAQISREHSRPLPHSLPTAAETTLIFRDNDTGIKLEPQIKIEIVDGDVIEAAGGEGGGGGLIGTDVDLRGIRSVISAIKAEPN